MKIFALHRPGSPTFSVFTRFKVGSVDESVGETGIAHILEHMLFKGSKKVGTTNYAKEEKLMRKVEAVGRELDAERLKGLPIDKQKTAELKKEMKRLLKEQREFIVTDEIATIYSRNGGASFNAFTGNDTTTYVVKLPANRLELWAWLESDRLRSPVLREYYAERDVVMEERRRSVDSTASGTLYEQFNATAFTAHPYKNPVIGWASDIATLPKKSVAKFLKTYYSPNNMVVAFVGDIEPEKVFRLMEKYFGDIPAQKIPKRVSTKEPTQKGERRIEVLFDAKPQVMIGFHKPAMPKKENYVFDIITSLLTSGRTSRLYKSLVLEKNIAVSVEAWTGPGSRYDNLLNFYAMPRSPHTVKEVEDAIYRELERLANEPVKKRELQKVLNKMEADFIRGLRSNSGLAYHISNYETLTGDWRYMTRYLDEVKKVTPKDIQTVARKYLIKKNRTVAVLVNSKKGAGK